MSVTRRQFLSQMALGLAAAVVGPGIGYASAPPAQAPAPARLAATGAARQLHDAHHLAWVWQFATDGEPDRVRGVLAEHGLGVVLKSHDGTNWMADYDASRHAVNGASQLERLVAFFESAGVPVHAWCVLKGREPKREAVMCAEVLEAGARSMTLDVEPHEGFWTATAEEAKVFGEELRRRQPNAWLSVSIDPRPWHLTRIPLREFASFSNVLSPQFYWESYNTPYNSQYFARHGTPAADSGITPAFLVQALRPLLAGYGLPIHPKGEGSSDPAKWHNFMENALAEGADAVSVWRFGVTPASIWQLLRDNPPLLPAIYTVQPGDTLSSLAAQWQTTVPAIMERNGLQNPNFLRVGQQLVLPGRANGPQRADAEVYMVQPGDTLSILAKRWNTTVSSIADLNRLSNPNQIQAGMQLQLPHGQTGTR